MDEFNAGQDIFSCAKRVKAEHRARHAFDGAMVLFDEVIEVLDLRHDDGYFLISDDLIDRRFIGAALLRRDFFRHAIILHGLVEEPHDGCLVALCG